MSWDQLDSWWIEELEKDPAYEEEITPQLLRLLMPRPGSAYLDLGCGTGRVMSEIQKAGARAIGIDLNRKLLAMAAQVGPVVRGVLPSLSWARDKSFDGAYLGLVLEHLNDEAELFREAARVVKPGGILAMVINHPIWTAPGSSPIEDENGEVLYRPGTYFGRGSTEEPAGAQTIPFYHRTTAALLTAASRAGWDLSQMEESGLTPSQLARFPEYAGQEQIPRLLGTAWTRRLG
jgi:ubiquinone/menaquinone biosynthesis C-methylase UbiE